MNAWKKNPCGSLDGRKPKSNTDYWHPKLARNVERDRQHLEKLHAVGWCVLVVWECELRDQPLLMKRLQDFLGPARLATGLLIIGQAGCSENTPIV